MNTKPTHRLLENLLINKEFQLRFLSYFGALFLINAVTLYSCIYLFFWKLKAKALAVGIPDGHVFFTFIGNQKSDLDVFFLGLVILNFFILLFVGLLVSHRIAGPIHKLKKYLIKSDAASSDFILRKNDFFRELGPVVNDFKDKLK